MNNAYNQITEILSRQDLNKSYALVHAERMYLSDYERRAIHDLKDIDFQYRHFRPIFDPPHLRFKNELHRLRYFFGLYVESLDNVRLKKSIVSAIEKLIITLKCGRSNFDFFIQVLREQKRLRQKIKLLFLPTKIIPDSLRPIKSVA